MAFHTLNSCPPIQRRLQNLAKMDREKRQRLIDGLFKALDIKHEKPGARVNTEPGA